MPTQKDAGKAFEYALIKKSQEIFIQQFNQVLLVENASYNSARNSFNLFDQNEKNRYDQASITAINHLIEVEQRLNGNINQKNSIQLELQSDVVGQHGDVRDVRFIRADQNWEIGISAKNNHKAVKHSRLSATKDFGEDWLDINCSEQYFEEIQPVFNLIETHKENNILTWPEVPNKHTTIYRPILEAFKNELMRIHENNLGIPKKLVQYLIGTHDFYKIVRRKNRVEIYGFNLHNTLGGTIPRLHFPTAIIGLNFKPGKNDTLELYCNNGWNISFRIHNAETKLIGSLKFDVNLIANPGNMYVHHSAY